MIPILGTGAETPSDDRRFGQEILEILRAEGTIDDARYEELKAKEEAEWAEQQRAGDSAESKSDPKGYGVEYRNGLQFYRNDGFVKLKFGGRIQADFATIHPDASLRAALIANTGDDPQGNGVEFRRARLYMSGELYGRIIFKSQFDFASGEVKFNDMYIGMKGLGPIGTVRVGHMKEPWGLEQLTSSNDITFMERALPAIIDEVRNVGIAANNSFLNDRLTYGLGIFYVTDDQGRFFDDSGRWNLTGRVSGLPWYAEDGRKFLHLGIGGSYQHRRDVMARFEQRPESHLSEPFLDTGPVTTDGGGLLNGELALVYGPFSVQGELKWARARQVDAPNPDLWGGYVYASWYLTGENRVLDPKKGIFKRITPRKSFNPAEGGWGAWEVAARYSYADLEDQTLNGGREQNFTLGLNWHLFSNVLMRFNYVFADVLDTGDELGNASGHVDLFQMRAQIVF